MIVPHPLGRARHIAARIALWLFLVALLAVGGLAAGAGVGGATAATAHAHLIGQPALANTCAGSQVPC